MRAYTLLPLVLMIAACAGEVDPSTESTEQPQVTEPGPVACDTYGTTQACETEAGAVGQSECQYDAERDYELYFSACGDTTVCSPGETQSCGFDDGMFAGLSRGCTLRDGAWVWDEAGCNTPLVLSFDNQPVEFTQRPSNSLTSGKHRKKLALKWAHSPCTRRRAELGFASLRQGW